MDGDDIPFDDKNEQIPLVVPDAAPVAPVEEPERYARIRAAGILCIANTKSGTLCKFPHIPNSQYCYSHDPAIPADVRKANRCKMRAPRIPSFAHVYGGSRKAKTIDDVKLLLSMRLDAFLERFGAMSSPEVEETICDMVRTYVAVHKCTSDEAALGLAHWSRSKKKA